MTKLQTYLAEIEKNDKKGKKLNAFIQISPTESSSKGKLAGKNHPFYGKKRSLETVEKMKNALKDRTIYSFKNILTNEEFIGIKYDFIKKFNLI